MQNTICATKHAHTHVDNEISEVETLSVQDIIVVPECVTNSLVHWCSRWCFAFNCGSEKGCALQRDLLDMCVCLAAIEGTMKCVCLRVIVVTFISIAFVYCQFDID